MGSKSSVPQGHLVGTEAGALRPTTSLEGREGRGVVLQAVGSAWRWPTLLSPLGTAPGLLIGPSPWLASRVWGHAGLSPRQNLLVDPTVLEVSQQRGNPSSSRAPAAAPLAASEPVGRGLSLCRVVATPPQALCLCDPGGTECGNGAGGQGAQRMGRGGVSGHGPSSCRSLVCSWSSG